VEREREGERENERDNEREKCKALWAVAAKRSWGKIMQP